VRQTIYDYECPGVLQGTYNKDSSICSFARACCEYALSVGQDLWFSTKDTISKQYDQTFKLLFQKIYEEEYKEKFEKAGITYFYTLIDDAVARVVRSEGGFVWALKNYDGDVMSDMVSTAFGSLAMMTSCLVSPDGNFEYEPRTAPLRATTTATFRARAPRRTPSPRSLRGRARSISGASSTATRHFAHLPKSSKRPRLPRLRAAS
jgi:NADP-dependent isocitrate dehydrogenase